MKKMQGASYGKAKWRGFGMLALALSGMFLVSCGHTPGKKEAFDSVAHQPKNPAAVRLKVSLSKQVLYVKEGARTLLVTPVCVGTASDPTPTGNFRIIEKKRDKRSTSFGMYVNRATGSVRGSRSGRGGRGESYVGYPLPFWLRFNGAYGFHSGYVWPQPHTHGCIRLHQNVAPKLFAMVQNGTPVEVSRSLPEDATLGRDVKRPTNWQDPDPPMSYTLSDQPFAMPPGPLFEG